MVQRELREVHVWANGCTLRTAAMFGPSVPQPSSSAAARARGRGSACRRTGVVLPWFVGLVGSGCQPELPRVSWEGEVIQFASNDTSSVCGDTVEWMDARAVGLQSMFGASARERVIFYWVPDLWSDQPWCREPAAGCVDGDRVYTEYIPQEHEIVHAIRRDQLPAVLEEGLATVFGDLGWTRAPAPRARLVEMFEQSDPVDNADYARAGHFVAFLLERSGMEPLARLAELADYGDDVEVVRDAFEQAYGISLDQAIDEYESFPECDALAWTNKTIACSGEPQIRLEPSIAADAEFVVDIECSNSDVLGPYGGYMFTETILDIEPGLENLQMWISLVGDLEGDVSAALVSCEGGCSGSTSLWLTASSLEQRVLPAGRYVLRMFRPIDQPGDLGISLRY